MHQGLSERITSGGLSVMRLHYTADAKKRPGTPAGDAWLQRAVLGYPGGTDSPRWKKEYEIKYGALGGMALFPRWEEWTAAGRIIVPVIDATNLTLYGSYDHGWLHNSVYLVHGMDAEGRAATLWECCAGSVPVKHWAKIIKGESTRLLDGREFQGNPYAGREQWRIADPSMWQERNAQSDGANKATSVLFEDEGVFFDKGMRGGDTTVAEWLHGYWWEDPMEPRYQIAAGCVGLIAEIGKQRFKDISANAALNKAVPETLVDRDNDAWDALKYWLLRFPPKATKAKPAPKPNTFAWWMRQGQPRRQRGAMTYSYVPR